jgi:hypothetical protein
MPLYMTLSGLYGYGRSHLPPFDAVDLGSFSNWHGANASSIAQTSITSCYNYLFDGSISTINSGGYNMWNIGNFVSIEGAQTDSNISYGTISGGAGSGYFLSQSNAWPQVGLAYLTSGTIQWDNAGTVGLFGSPFGSNANFDGTYTTTNQGRVGSYWVNQKYGLANPTICYLWFTIQDPQVNSILSGFIDGRNTIQPPDYTYTQYFSITGSKILFAQMLLSVRNPSSFPNGFLIPQATIENFLSNYVQAADIRLE